MIAAQLQLLLELVPLPGPDWPDEVPYRDERDREGRPRSCPALYIDAAGRRWRYVGGLVDGQPRYEELPHGR